VLLWSFCEEVDFPMAYDFSHVSGYSDRILDSSHVSGYSDRVLDSSQVSGYSDRACHLRHVSALPHGL